MSSSYIQYGNYEFDPTQGRPVPQISISNEQERDGAGKAIGLKTIISLEGVVCHVSGSLDRNFQALLNKEKDIREAFEKDGQFLKIGWKCETTGPNGKTTQTGIYLSGYPRVTRYSSDKTDNYWLNTIGYNVELQLDNQPLGGSTDGIFAVSSTQDEINIETIDEFAYTSSPYPGIRGSLSLQGPFSQYPIYRISRTLGAVGKHIFTSGNDVSGAIVNPVSNARQWVNHHIGKNPLSGYLTGLNLYNMTRSVSVSQPEGSYRITDNWLAWPTGFSGLYTESFNAEASLDSSMLRTVVINGTIKGLELSNNGLLGSAAGTGLSGIIYPTHVKIGNAKFSNALSGYSGIRHSLFGRANAFLEPSGDRNSVSQRFFGRNEPPLNPIPLSVTEGYNPSEGSVTYSWTYNNRPLNMISGSISEVLTIEDNLSVQQVAEIFVLGRRLGPVLQNLGTYSVPTRNVTFEVVMPRPSSLSGIRFPAQAYAAITGLVESFNPTYLLNNTIQYAVKSDTENWSVSEGRFVKTKQWIWTRCI